MSRLAEITETAKCPFFISTTSGSGYMGILCESLISDEDLGFHTVNHLKLSCKRDLKDYAELFCCDMWRTCPYARAVLTFKYKEQ